MGFPYLILGVLVFVRLKLAYFVGLVICAILLIHPLVFGRADLVVAFYLFLWLFVKDKNHSVFLGRLFVSFIFFGAAMGKLTPGWWSGEQLQNIVHLRKISTAPLVIMGEFLMAVSFLLPSGIACLVTIIILAGMSWAITDLSILMLTLPILGMALTFLAIDSLEKSRLTLYFDEDKGTASLVYQLFDLLKIDTIKLETIKKAPVTDNPENVMSQKGGVLQAQNEYGTRFYGFDCWVEIVSRVAMIAFLSPLFKLKRQIFSRK